MSAAETIDVNQPEGTSSQALAHKIVALTNELAAERCDAEKLSADLADANMARAVLERDKALAEAVADEAHRRTEQLEIEHSLLLAQLATGNRDHELALDAMGRWSKRRYERRRAAVASHPTGQNEKSQN